MPTGFDKYNEDMKRFEATKLFKEKYNEFLDIISMPFRECKSSTIESMLKIHGTSVRRLVRHARRKGCPVVSNEKGYSIAHNYNELKPTIEQLQDRALDMLHTLKYLKQCFPDETQETLSIAI